MTESLFFIFLPTTNSNQMKSSFGVWAVSKMRSGHYLETLGLIMFGQFLKLWYAQQVPPTDELELK